MIQKASLKSKTGRIKWLCLCDCGKVVEVAGGHLKNGHTTSCGCKKSENRVPVKPTVKDLTGVRFGRLTAIRRTEEYASNGSVKWECKCDCGGATFVNIDALTSGSTRSCGCLSKENKNRIIERLEGELVENTSLCLLTSKTPKNNTSGRKGVYWSSRKQRWRAYINFQKKRYCLGSFYDYEKAVQAREEAEAKFFAPMLEKYGRAENG